MHTVHIRSVRVAARLAALALALMLAFSSVGFVAAHQDATPAVGECDAPALPPGTPTPMEDMEGMEDMDMEGTPVSDIAPVDEDVPEPTPAPAGEPADEETVARVEAALLNFAACFNLGDYEGWVALMTENQLLQEFGTTNPYDAIFFVQVFGELVDLTLLAVENVQQLEDGRFSADVDLVFGNQVGREREYLVEEDGYLKFDAFEELEAEQPAGESVTVEITTDEHEFQPSDVTVQATDVIVVQGRNAGEYDHEIAIVQLPEGFEPERIFEVFEGTAPEGIRFIGGIDIEPGGEAEMYLVDLAPGTYTMLCIFDEPDGVPHVMEGMHGTFTVEAA